MPIPTPKSEDDLGACLRFLRREKPNMENKQRVAICLSKYQESKGSKK